MDDSRACILEASWGLYLLLFFSSLSLPTNPPHPQNRPFWWFQGGVVCVPHTWLQQQMGRVPWVGSALCRTWLRYLQCIANI